MSYFLSDKKTIITCHRNADFDAVCSLFAISYFFPTAQIVYPGSQEKAVQTFIDEIITPLFTYVSPKEADYSNIERLIIVDTSHTTRISHLTTLLEQAFLFSDVDFPQKAKDLEIIIFDHHPQTNILHDFGMVDIVGSTCTLICEELIRLKIDIPCEILHILGLGIYADTGAFTFNSVSARDTKVLTFLIEKGFSPDFVTPYVSRQINKEQLFILNDLVELAKFYDIAGIKFALASANVENFLYDIASLAPMFLEIYPCEVLFMVTSMDGKVSCG